MSEAFDITIAAYDYLKHENPFPDLENDVKLVKSALLYGDHVTLMSFPATLTYGTTFISGYSAAERRPILKRLSRFLSDPRERRRFECVFAEYELVLAQPNTSASRALRLHRSIQEVDQFWPGIQQAIDSFLDRTHVDELTKALASGLVDLYEFGSWYKGYSDHPRNEFVFVLDELLAHPKDFLMLDYATLEGLKVDATGGQSNVSKVSATKLRGTSLATELIERLPHFDMATIEEVLDIRKQLGGSVVRFRAEVLKLAEKMDNDPWSKEFSQEVDIIVHRDIAPAVAEIEEAIQANHYLDQLIPRLTDRSTYTVPAASALALAVTNLMGVTDSILGAVAGGVAIAAVDAERSRRHQDRQNRQHSLFFYQGARMHLERGDFARS